MIDRLIGQSSRWWPLAPLVALTGALSFLLSRQLHIRAVSDEGNYVLSLQAFEHGESLGRQIFISQPPGFFLWLRGLAVVFGDSLHDARLAMIATVVLAAVALYVTGAKLVNPVGGLAAAALLAIIAPLSIEGAQVYADTPANALGAVAITLAAVRLPLAAGVALTAAMSCKFSGATALLPVVALVYTRSARPWRALAQCLAGAAALAIVLVLVFVNDLGAIWRGTVSYHVTSQQFVGFRWQDKLGNWVSFHSVYLYFVAAGLVLTAVRARRLWPLWLWPASSILFLIVQKPLHDNHMLVLPYSFACAAGPALGTVVEGLRLRLATALSVLGALAFGAGFVQELHWADQQTKGEDPRLVRAAQFLERVTKPGDLVISDQAIVALMAHRRVPGEVADSSVMRFAAGNLTGAEIGHLITTKPIEAVVVARAFAVPFIEPTVVPRVQRSFLHVRRLPAATIYYGRRYPPVPSAP
jgi:4-amino-4-deoxy-L-arabinose transferase-like glycosyltransferase